MNIVNDLKEQLKQAMKNNDSEKKDYIRSILAKITEYCVEQGLERNKPLSNENATKVIASLKKSLEKALKMFEKGGMDIENELVQHYRKEIAFYENFLPSDEKQGKQAEWVSDAISELGVTDIKQAGRVIGHIMKTYKNEQPDGALIKKLVLQRLSE